MRCSFRGRTGAREGRVGRSGFWSWRRNIGRTWTRSGTERRGLSPLATFLETDLLTINLSPRPCEEPGRVRLWVPESLCLSSTLEKPRSTARGHEKPLDGLGK